MLFDNTINRRQAETGAFAGFFGGKEWFENPRQIFRVNARAGIAYRDTNKLTGLCFRMGFSVGGIDIDGLRGNDN